MWGLLVPLAACSKWVKWTISILLFNQPGEKSPLGISYLLIPPSCPMTQTWKLLCIKAGLRESVLSGRRQHNFLHNETPHLPDVGMKLCSQFNPCRALTLSAYTLLSPSPPARACIMDLSLQQGSGGIVLTLGLLPGFPLDLSKHSGVGFLATLRSCKGRLCHSWRHCPCPGTPYVTFPFGKQQQELDYH